MDSLLVKPLSEFNIGGVAPGESSDGTAWFDQLAGGDLNKFIALISALMILLGAALIIRPKERVAPQPWEMGTLEVEREEELTREAMGISEEEEIDSASMLRPKEAGDEPIEDEGSDPTPDELWDEADPASQAPQVEVSIGDLVESEPDDVGLEDLNLLADAQEGEEDDDDDIDTSFIDEAME